MISLPSLLSSLVILKFKKKNLMLMKSLEEVLPIQRRRKKLLLSLILNSKLKLSLSQLNKKLIKAKSSLRMYKKDCKKLSYLFYNAI